MSKQWTPHQQEDIVRMTIPDPYTLSPSISLHGSSVKLFVSFERISDSPPPLSFQEFYNDFKPQSPFQIQQIQRRLYSLLFRTNS